jgi:dihydroxyacetone kinase
MEVGMIVHGAKGTTRSVLNKLYECPQTLRLTKITKVKSLMADNIITNKFDTYLILS